jgi:hypothetical protein
MNKEPTRAAILNIFKRHSTRAGIISVLCRTGGWAMKHGLQSGSDIYSRVLALSFIKRPLLFWFSRHRQVDRHHERALPPIPIRMEFCLLECAGNIRRHGNYLPRAKNLRGLGPLGAQPAWRTDSLNH